LKGSLDEMTEEGSVAVGMIGFEKKYLPPPHDLVGEKWHSILLC